MDELKILLVGIGGFGAGYVTEMQEHGAQHHARLVGIVDPYAEKSPVYETARSLTSAFYDTLEAFYQENTADLAIIATPIPLHAPQAVYCMEHGSHVLTEKPIAGSVADAQRMINARNRTGKQLAVGFQWCYDEAMLAFRKDVQAGEFGRLLSLKSIVLWPRDLAYYGRTSGWAGKKYDKNGHPIFDSVASNATAHYLENLLWLAGRDLTDMQAVTARANPIETFDTIALKGKAGDADLFYVASHAAGREFLQNPLIECVFEKGSTRYMAVGASGYELTVRRTDGTEKSYGLTRSDPGSLGRLHVWKIADAIRANGQVDCTAEQALLHARVIEQVHNMIPESYVFPAEQVRLDDNMNWVPGLAQKLQKSWEDCVLPEL